MNFNKLDDIYQLIYQSKYDELHKYNKEDVEIVKLLKFPNLELELDLVSKKCLKDVRINSNHFRKQIITKYNKCALTDINSNLCEAAHIIPYNICTDYEKYNENNAILLSCNMHKAFDNNYFTIDETTCKIKILYDTIYNNNINTINELDLQQIKNKYIPQLDNNESKQFLQKRNYNIVNEKL